ncbi:MAG: hypothetical protein GY761_01890 [Hyphomicrobiales bacterium]|nr:hypothetical protein [Hyphomicrobiales bacterium]
MSVSNASAEEIEVLGQYFYGEIAIDESHKVRKKINRIPNIPEKTCFGWVINVKPANQLVKITEILKLPAAPKIWDGVEDNSYSQTTTSNDRKTATTKQFMALKSGKLENSWCLSKGDPSGDHHIIVLKEDQILAEFEFVIYD